MCTISGIILYDWPEELQKQLEWRACITSMLLAGQDRGWDATGIIHWRIVSQDLVEDAGRIRVALPAEQAVKLPIFDTLMANVKRGSILMMNNRAQPLPEGDSKAEGFLNYQPVNFQDWWVTHNGTISNDKALVKEFGFKLTSQVDTEVVAALFQKAQDKGLRGMDLAKEVSKELAGGFAIAGYNGGEFVYLLKNFKTLYMATDRENRFVAWNSEKKNLFELRQMAGRDWKDLAQKVELTSDLRIVQVPPYTGVTIAVLEAEEFEDIHSYRIIGAMDKPEIRSDDIEFKRISYIPEPSMQKGITICSGGIDSVTAAAVGKFIHGVEDMTLLHIDYGQIASQAEWAAIKVVAQKLSMKSYQIKVPGLGSLSTPLVGGVDIPLGTDSNETTKCWVPARNLVLLSLGAAIAESSGVKFLYSGFNLEESGVYPDNDIEFLQKMNEVLHYGTLYGVQLKIALERLMKAEIIKLGMHLGVPFESTWSCDTDGKPEKVIAGGAWWAKANRGFFKACGICGCCWTRRHAFMKAGIEDPQKYFNEQQEEAVWESGNWSNNYRSVDEIIDMLKSKQ